MNRPETATATGSYVNYTNSFTAEPSYLGKVPSSNLTNEHEVRICEPCVFVVKQDGFSENDLEALLR